MNIDPKHMLKQVLGLEKAFKALDERLAGERRAASAGAEPLTANVTVNGLGDLVDLEVSVDLAATGDAAHIQATIKEAFMRALKESRAFRQEERMKLTAGLKLPDI